MEPPLAIPGGRLVASPAPTPGRRHWRRRLALVLGTLIVVAIPVVLVGNMLWLLVSPTFVRAQYALPGNPAMEGVSPSVGRELGLTGARVIRPGGDGLSALEHARLRDGTQAFSGRQIRHMADVQALVASSLTVWAMAALAAVGSALLLRRHGFSRAAVQALRLGADATIAATFLIGLAMALDFDAVFATFHGVFFAGDSWRFSADSTLLQLYPEIFWTNAGLTAAGLVLLQSVGLGLGARRLLAVDRRRRPAPAARPSAVRR